MATDARPPEVLNAARPLHWLTVLLAGLLAVRHLHFHLSRSGTGAFALLWLTAAAMLANLASLFDRSSDWLAYHFLVVGVVATGVPVLWRARFMARSPRFTDLPAGVTPSLLGWRVDLSLGIALSLGFGLVLRETLAPGLPPTGIWFPAALVLMLAVQAGVRALDRRSEMWAAVATLGCVFAMSLVVWDLHGRAFDQPAWTVLLQANSAILSLGALSWLALGRRPTASKRLSLVGIEILLALMANAFLLLDPPLLDLVRSPDSLSPSVICRRRLGFLAEFR